MAPRVGYDLGHQQIIMTKPDKLTMQGFRDRLIAAVGNEDEELTKDILKQSTNIIDLWDIQIILETARNACVVALEKSNLSLTKIVFAKNLVFVDDKLYPTYNQKLMDAAITSDFVGGLRFLKTQGLVFEFPTWNALRQSVEKGKLSTVGYLLNIPRIKLHLKFPYDKTLIAIAASKCDMKMINILLNSKAKDFINYTCSTKGYAALHHCLEAGPKNADSFDCVKLLVENGADVNLDEAKKRGRSPLLMAVEYNLLDVVLFLIDAGADVTTRDSERNTVLRYLAERRGSCDASRVNTCIERLMATVGNENEKLTKDVLKRSIYINKESDREEILQIARNACVEALEKSNLSLTKTVFAKKLVFVDDKLCPKYNQKLIEAAITSDFVGGLRFLEAQGLVFEFPTWNALRESVEKGKLSIVGYLLDIPWIKLHLKSPFDKTLVAIAASKCDIKMLNTLLNSKAKGFINYTCSANGYAALHHCLNAGPKNADTLGCVKLLVENGADVNLGEKKNEKRRSPLLMAIEYNMLDVVLFLIDAGAEVTARDSRRNTVLHYLAERRISCDASRLNTCVERLVSGGVNINTKNRWRETALFMAINKRKHDVAKALIKHGAELNMQQGETPWTVTALTMAFSIRNPIGIKILMDAGCEIDDLNEKGREYLMKAVKNGWADVVQGLIERGVDIHARDEKGQTALYYCHDKEGRNLGQILPFLESVGFDILEDDSGEAFLNLAISRLDLDAIDFLVKHQVNVSQISSCRQSILHRLARKKSERDDLQRLFEYGIDVDQRETREGSAALIEATTCGNVRFVKSLINNGCNINIANNYGITAVIKAAIEMKKITLKLLLKSGANANLLNNSGQPAVNYLDLSKPDDYKDCLRWILHFGGGKSVQFPDRTGLTLLERLVHRPFIEPIWYLITANCNFQPLVNRAPPKKLDETFLPIAKALYESGAASREIAKLLGEKTKQEFHEYVTSKFSLKSVCRRSIRIHLGLGITEKVQRLHIPSTVKDYLLMKSIIPVEYSNLADGVELDEDEEPKYFFTPSAEFLKYM